MTERAAPSPHWVVLRRDGVMVALDVGGPQLPRIVHWGSDLGALSDSEIAELPAAAYVPSDDNTHNADVPLTISPTRAQGWSGWPGLTGHRDGTASQPLFVQAAVDTDESADGQTLRYRGIDEAAALRLDGDAMFVAVAQDPRHLHLGDPDAVRYLRLREIVDEAQAKHLALALT